MCVLNIDPHFAYVRTHIYIYVYVKKNERICKNVLHFLIRTSTTCLWFASGFVQEVPGYVL